MIVEVRNCMEDLVFEVLDEVIERNKDMCKCPKCRADIAAIALNFLPSRYIATARGEMYSKIKTLEQQFAIDIITAITYACQIVGKNPHHGRGE
ncbi:late competence development ComFB family protein [Propionispora hippei]|uniref:late competence development ComFB family protein n=1 Tax=Propionispora hippei TaxID=209080 RepID=UPI001CB6BF95|nr:late competence development ComFB family protein [Propionispora hippei]